MRLEDAQAILRLRPAEEHHRVLWGQYALRTWLEKVLPMDDRHLGQNHLGGGRRAPDFTNGIQIGGNIEREREKSHLQVSEEEVVEDRPDRAEMVMEVQATPHRQHRRLPDR